MKENLTSINVIIDKSGSMEQLANDTIGSFNSFLAEQKAVPGEALFTLCTFSTDYNLVHDFVELSGVPNLNPKVYRPNGGTALLDALGTTIDSVGAKLAALPESDRPSKVIFLIITDGEENSSRRFTKTQIKSMIEHQQQTYNWEFVFMGANLDAISEGASLGISPSNSMGYVASAAGTRSLYNYVSSNMRSYRMGSRQKVNFFDQTLAGAGVPDKDGNVVPVVPGAPTPVQNPTPGTNPVPGALPTEPNVVPEPRPVTVPSPRPGSVPPGTVPNVVPTLPNVKPLVPDGSDNNGSQPT